MLPVHSGKLKDARWTFWNNTNMSLLSASLSIISQNISILLSSHPPPNHTSPLFNPSCKILNLSLHLNLSFLPLLPLYFPTFFCSIFSFLSHFIPTGGSAAGGEEQSARREPGPDGETEPVGLHWGHKQPSWTQTPPAAGTAGAAAGRNLQVPPCSPHVLIHWCLNQIYIF